jgi:hypothetical protein
MFNIILYTFFWSCYAHLIQYKKVVVPGKDQNAHVSNAAIWQK